MDEKLVLIAEKESFTQQPGFWDDPKKAEEQLRVIARLKSWTIDFDKVNSSIEDLIVLNYFFREGESSEQEVENQYFECITMVEDLEVRNMLRNEGIGRAHV